MQPFVAAADKQPFTKTHAVADRQPKPENTHSCRQAAQDNDTCSCRQAAEGNAPEMELLANCRARFRRQTLHPATGGVSVLYTATRLSADRHARSLQIARDVTCPFRAREVGTILRLRQQNAARFAGRAAKRCWGVARHDGARPANGEGIQISATFWTLMEGIIWVRA